jgi:hypothetical protein
MFGTDQQRAKYPSKVDTDALSKRRLSLVALFGFLLLTISLLHPATSMASTAQPLSYNCVTSPTGHC